MSKNRLLFYEFEANRIIRAKRGENFCNFTIENDFFFAFRPFFHEKYTFRATILKNVKTICALFHDVSR